MWGWEWKYVGSFKTFCCLETCVTLGKQDNGSTLCSRGVIEQADFNVHIWSACPVSSINASCFNNGLFKTSLKEKVVMLNVRIQG
jgi:hypothetical protein